MRAVQRAYAPSPPRSQARWRRSAPTAWVQPDAVLEVAYGVLDPAWRVDDRPTRVQRPRASRSVDEGVIASIWRRGRAGNRAIGFTRRTMSRTGCGVRLGLERGVSRPATPGPRRRPSSREWESSRSCWKSPRSRSRRLARWRMVIEKRTSISRQGQRQCGRGSRCRPAPPGCPLAPP